MLTRMTSCFAPFQSRFTASKRPKLNSVILLRLPNSLQRCRQSAIGNRNFGVHGEDGKEALSDLGNSLQRDTL